MGCIRMPPISRASLSRSKCPGTSAGKASLPRRSEAKLSVSTREMMLRHYTVMTSAALDQGMLYRVSAKSLMLLVPRGGIFSRIRFLISLDDFEA